MDAFESIHVGTDHHHDCVFRDGPGDFDYVQYDPPVTSCSRSSKTRARCRF